MLLSESNRGNTTSNAQPCTISRHSIMEYHLKHEFTIYNFIVYNLIVHISSVHTENSLISSVSIYFTPGKVSTESVIVHHKAYLSRYQFRTGYRRGPPLTNSSGSTIYTMFRRYKAIRLTLVLQLSSQTYIRSVEWFFRCFLTLTPSNVLWVTKHNFLEVYYLEGVIFDDFVVYLRSNLLDTSKNRLVTTVIMIEVIYITTVGEMNAHRLFQNLYYVLSCYFALRRINNFSAEELSTPYECIIYSSTRCNHPFQLLVYYIVRSNVSQSYNLYSYSYFQKSTFRHTCLRGLSNIPSLCHNPPSRICNRTYESGTWNKYQDKHWQTPMIFSAFSFTPELMTDIYNFVNQAISSFP